MIFQDVFAWLGSCERCDGWPSLLNLMMDWWWIFILFLVCVCVCVAGIDVDRWHSSGGTLRRSSSLANSTSRPRRWLDHHQISLDFHSNFYISALSVVESILRGGTAGVTSRRSRAATQVKLGHEFEFLDHVLSLFLVSFVFFYY